MGLREDLNTILAKKYAALERLSLRLSQSKKSGAFYRFTTKKRSSLLSRFNRLTKSVNQLKWQVNLAAVGATVAVLTNTNDAIAQSSFGPFVKQNRAANPLRHPLRGMTLKPTIVDLDNDGDYDIVTGQQYSYYLWQSSRYINIFLNEGTPSKPLFTDYFALDQNGDPISLGYNLAPAFADLNGDGNLDLILGTHNASVDRIRYFTGNGGIPGNEANPLLFTEQFGSWDEALKTGNPFNDLSFLPNITPTFVDFDNDGDLDALIGTNFYKYSGYQSLRYLVNDGASNFVDSSLPTNPAIDLNRVSPQLADVDKDGNLDLVLGHQFGDIRFFKGNGTSYTEQFGVWDPVLKTGNPFSGIDFGRESAPALVDLDNDGDLDLVLGFYKYYGSHLYELAYFVNSGNANFKEMKGFDSPFNGVDVGDDAVPFFVDADGNGDLDVLIGGKYVYPEPYNQLLFLTNSNGEFSEPNELDNPFANIVENAGDGLAPVAINLDGDDDLEVVAGTENNGIQYFDKVDGVYERLVGADSPFNGLVNGRNERLTFGDIDGDGDLDSFVGGDLDSPNYGKVLYLKNTGTAETPEFSVMTGADNPLDAAEHDGYEAVPVLVDIDNDGDLDAIITENGYVSDGGGDVFFFENTGTPTNPIFVKREVHAFQNLNFPYDPELTFIDFDKDGDEDLFVGGYDGRIVYYINSNPAPITTTTSSVLSYTFGSGPIVIDANLTLADTDGDDIIGGSISIQNFQPGNEALTFVAQAPVTGNFNTTTGVLTLQGKAPAATYQAILRSVAYEYTGADPGSRKGKAGKVKALSRTIAFAVADADKTNGQTASRTISITSQGQNPPIIAKSTLTTVINNSVTIDLATIISDPDGNLDPLSFKIIPNVTPTPARVGNATIVNTQLTVDYVGTNFAGTDYVTIEACDLGGLCASEEISIDVAGGIIVRNGISPNGDIYNQYFKLENITTLGPQNKVSIYSRWGDKIFEIENYDNLTRRFEGKSDNGKELPNGVYFYKIEFSNGKADMTGYLTLKR